MLKIQNLTVFFVILSLFLNVSANGQTKKNDIPVKDLPAEVLATLNGYAEALSAETLEKCAEAFIKVAGGSLVNDSGENLRPTIMQFSLKKDFSNFKFYAMPLEITRVNKKQTNGDGYGASAIKGTAYKIWLKKKAGVNGMPAPVSIVVPEGHPTIKTPKVVGIGSL